MFKRKIGAWGKWGISRVLVLMLIVTLAPIIVLELYRGSEDVQRRRQAIEQQAQTQATEAAQVTSDYLATTGRLLSALAGTPAVRSLDPDGSQALFESFRRPNPNYESVFLFGTDGTEKASTEPAFRDSQFIQRLYVRSALTSGSMTISDVLALPGTDRSVLVLARRVPSADGTPVGVMGIALNIARLSSVIGYARLPKDSVVLLVQHDGTTIASNTYPETWVGQTLTGLSPFQGGKTPTRAGSTTGSMRDGLRRVVAYQPVEGTSWLMLAAVPQAEVNTALRQSLTRVSEEAALVLLATILLAWLMIRRVVVPIRMLSDGARAFANGYLDRRISIRRRDELGDLAGALNSMAGALHERLKEDAAHAEALRALNRLQTEFVATASHELKTPVTAIRTYAEALMRPEISDPDTRRRCLEGIDHSSERLVHLVRTLLDVSRIDSGQVDVRLRPADAVAITQRAIAQTTPREEVTVSIATSDELPQVLADPERLEDVLANLVGNAVKFSPSSASISVDLRRAGREIQIAVRDRGDGIAAEELPRIFDRFYQVNRGMDRGAGGSGLGLYIARAYVSAMGGRIWAESAVGHGSTFYVALPVAGASDPPSWSDDTHASAAASAVGRR